VTECLSFSDARNTDITRYCDYVWITQASANTVLVGNTNTNVDANKEHAMREMQPIDCGKVIKW